MNFSIWSIRNPVPAIILFLFLTIAGLAAFHALPIKNLPDLDVPRFEISLNLPGVAPVQMEAEVVRPVEDAYASLRGVTSIRSSIREGSAVIRLDFALERKPYQVLTEIKDVFTQIRPDLPVSLEEPQYLQITAASSNPTVTYALTTASLSPAELSWFVTDTVARRIHAIPGVAEFDLLGAVAREIEIEIDPVKLAARGVTVTQVSEALRSTAQDASGGRGRIGGLEQGVRTEAGLHAPQDFETLHVTLSDKSDVRLDEVANIRDDVSERRTAAALDGVSAVGFRVLYASGADELKVIEAVNNAMAELGAQHPEVHAVLVSSMQEEIERQFRSSMRMIYEGALLAVVVMMFFLRNWRATLIGAVALPLSVIPSFAVLYAVGYSLNTVTLLAISVVVGVLVDDAIVEIENIERRLRMGQDPREATIQAVTEIGPAVIATTLAITAVFVPMAFNTGFSGLLFAHFSLTASAAVFISLLVARLITPVLAVHFMQSTSVRDSDLPQPLMCGYLKTVRWTLRFRGFTIASVAALSTGAVWLIFPTLPRDFIPDEDSSQTQISVELPPGSSIEATLAVAEEVRQALNTPTPVDGITHVFTLIGSPRIAGLTRGGGDGRTAKLAVSLKPLGDRPSEEHVEEAIRGRLKDIAGAKISVNGYGFNAQLAVRLSGRDPQLLADTAREVASEMATVPRFNAVSTAAGLERQDVVIRPNQALAASLGVSTRAIADTVRVATSGDFTPQLAKLNLDSRQVDVRVHLTEQAMENMSIIAALRVPGRYGPVPLSSVADVKLESSMLVLTRVNRERQLTVTADTSGMAAGEARAFLAGLPIMQSLPAGVSWVKGFTEDLMDEVYANFTRCLVLASILLYGLMAILFKDFLQPITILTAAPLSASGALAALWLEHGEIGQPALIGFIVLLGIVTKNSILLVDYALQFSRSGSSPTVAVEAAVRHRARPILMTSIAMIAGMTPQVVGFAGADVSFSRPMCSAIIGGLISSTFLSLFVVPCIFVSIEGFKKSARSGRATQTELRS